MFETFMKAQALLYFFVEFSESQGVTTDKVKGKVYGKDQKEIPTWLSFVIGIHNFKGVG